MRNDKELLKNVEKIKLDRINRGLKGIVGGLRALLISVEKENIRDSVYEMTDMTGYSVSEHFKNDIGEYYILKMEGSADLIIKSSFNKENKYKNYNDNPKSKKLINTRVEEFIFDVSSIEKYYEVQKKYGLEFEGGIENKGSYKKLTSKIDERLGVSYGFIEFKGEASYIADSDVDMEIDIPPSGKDYLGHVVKLDHTASRVRAKDRDSAILRFMEYTEYNFEFSIYVRNLNSITNVARLEKGEFAMVFTSGIDEYEGEGSGPTEKYIHNYGPRVHHMAFETENIDDFFLRLKKDGVEFLVELVGSEEEGLKQTFTVQSPYTMIVNEYIHRYGDFSGFFTKSNVEMLTRGTEKQ